MEQTSNHQQIKLLLINSLQQTITTQLIINSTMELKDTVEDNQTTIIISNTMVKDMKIKEGQHRKIMGSNNSRLQIQQMMV